MKTKSPLLMQVEQLEAESKQLDAALAFILGMLAGFSIWTLVFSTCTLL